MESTDNLAPAKASISESAFMAPRLSEVMERRRSDWRFGHVVYQVFVDRFAPSRRLEEKKHLYTAPRRLRGWEELPRRGEFHAEERITQGELDFWGGDLESLRGRVDYIQQVGADLIYLNPIFQAFSNHKYDGSDYFEIDPQYGTRQEVVDLADDLHRRGMRLMLDGVFNHMGRRAPVFAKAMTDADAAEREHFYFHENHKHGYRGWRNVANLPEINLEHAEVREMIYEAPDSVVQSYLKEVGIDGWRLDVAPDLGFVHLRELRQAAHRARQDSVVIGECWNYPEEWLEVLDGVMNMHARMLLLALIDGRMSPRLAGRAVERMIDDADYEGVLRSHMVLDNHDLPRLAEVVPEEDRRRLAIVLKFTLPGCPVIYYGSELGMGGGRDPENRAPMRWDLATDENLTLRLVKRLVRVRRENPSLRIGNFRLLDSEQVFAFLRYTDRARESMIVLANPSGDSVSPLVPLRDSRLMDAAQLECVLSGECVSIHCGTIQPTIGPWEARLFRTVDRGSTWGYSAFKRVP